MVYLNCFISREEYSDLRDGVQQVGWRKLRNSYSVHVARHYYYNEIKVDGMGETLSTHWEVISCTVLFKKYGAKGPCDWPKRK